MDVTKKILERIARLQAQLNELRDVRFRLASAEYSGASISSGGGSKSYTRRDAASIDASIKALEREILGYRRMLSGQPVTTTIATVYN